MSSDRWQVYAKQRGRWITVDVPRPEHVAREHVAELKAKLKTLLRPVDRNTDLLEPHCVRV